MYVAVIGGAGFIGSAVVRALVADGHRVMAIDNLISGSWKNLSEVRGDVHQIEADIVDESFVARMPRSVEVVVHLASPTPLCTRDAARQYHQIASTGTAHVLDWALSLEAPCIYASSISVYGLQRHTPISEQHPTEPVLVYGANKLHGERLCATYAATYGLRYDVLRMSDVFGPRDGRYNAINRFIDACFAGEPIGITGRGHQRRSYTFVDDVAAIIARWTVSPVQKRVYNVASPQAISINALAQSVIRATGQTTEVIHTGEDDGRDYVFSCDRLTERLGDWAFTDIEHGLALTSEYRRGLHR